jgi:hypothetical protein
MSVTREDLRETVTIASSEAEEEAVARANATYHRVMNSEWPGGKGDVIREALEGLTAALEMRSAVLNEDIHPASVYCELEHEDDAYDKALSMAAQDAGDWAAELDRLVPEEDEGERAAGATTPTATSTRRPGST